MNKLLKNLLLFLVAIAFFVVLAPIGFVYGLVTRLKFWVSGFFISMAIGIDQLWNVFAQYLFDDILIQKNGYKFGVEDETISSVLGKNKRDWTLKPLWKMMCCLLDKIDKNHCIKSIK